MEASGRVYLKLPKHFCSK